MARPTQLALILALLSLATAPAAGSLPSDILYGLPRESGEVGFVELRQVQGFPQYQVLKQRLVPNHFIHFERFLRPLGVDLDQNVEWLAWALVPPQETNPAQLFIGLAQGDFRSQQVDDFFREQKLPRQLYAGQTLYAFGSGQGPRDLFFTFLDSTTVAFGTRPALELLLETRFGGHESLLHNQTLLAHVREVNGQSPLWLVLDENHTRLAVRKLVPQAAKFPAFAGAARGLQSSLIQAELGGEELTLDFQAHCRNPADAQLLSLLFYTGLAVQRWQSEKTNRELAATLQRADIRTSGDRLTVHLTVPKDELASLLARSGSIF